VLQSEDTVNQVVCGGPVEYIRLKEYLQDCRCLFPDGWHNHK